MKKIYLDIMEKAVSIYTTQRIEEYIAEVRKKGLSEHGFPRLTADIGILTAHGRMLHLRPYFVQMMDLCCQEMPVAYRKYQKTSVGNEFSVKEIVMCLMTLEQYKAFPEEQMKCWKSAIQAMDPYAIYHHIAEVPAKPMHNWAAFAAVSEQLRIHAGLGAPGSAAFVDNQVASQLFNFDENGMYRDPNEPIVYDLTTRLQLSMAVFYGYNGANSKALMEQLNRGSLQNLYMQSVTGEIPFGGRSSQFLHNEPTFAALLEYDACRYAQLGDWQKAGECKTAAMLCAQQTLKCLNTEHVYHIKNGYDPDSGYGCEPYGYFNKYMVTTASFAHFAYLMADDNIQPRPLPDEKTNYIHRVSDHFHKTFIKFGDYFLEYETKADFHYDCNGLGRIHRKGAPSSICLSVPVTPTPNYGLDLVNPGPLSLCGGIDGRFSCEEGTNYHLTSQNVTDECSSLTWQVTLPGGKGFTEECSVTSNGITLRYTADEEISVRLPAFETDGWRSSRIDVTGNSAVIQYEGWKCCYDASAPLASLPEVYANRNGHYRALTACAQGSVEVHISIENTIG